MVISFIDLIYMIGRSISINAFDMELVIKIYTIILHCIFYMIGSRLQCSGYRIQAKAR